MKAGWQCIEEYEDNSGFALTRTYVYGNNIDEVLQMRDETPTLYYYVTNVQGNVVAITDEDGAVVEEYTYDIYGKAYRPLDITITGTWTGVTYNSNDGLTEFTDSGLSLDAGELKGGLVVLNNTGSGSHPYKQFVIFDNTATTIKIIGDVDSIGATDYEILAVAFAEEGSDIGNTLLFQGRRYDEESALYYFRNRQYDPVHGRFLSRDPMGYQDSYCLYAFVNNNPICYTDPSGELKVTVVKNEFNK